MATEEVIGIGVELQLANLRKQLASIPGLTADQAKLMVAELSKAQKAAEKSAKQSIAATRKTAEDAARATQNAAADLRAAADDAGDSASQIGAGVGLISDQAAAALQVLSDLADGVKGIGTAAQASGLPLRTVAAAVGVAAAAVAAAAIAYRVATVEVNRINTARQAEAEIAASLVPAYRALEDAEAELAGAMGQLSEAGLRELSVRRAAQRAVLDYAAAQKEARKEAYETIIANEAWADSQRSLARGIAIVAAFSTGVGVEGAKKWAASIEGSLDAVTGWRSSVEDARAQLARLNVATQEQADVQSELVTVTLATEKATRAKTAADKAAEEAEKQRAEAIRAYVDGLAGAAATHREAIAALQAIAAGQREAGAGELERLAIARDAALAQVELEEGRAASAANNEAARVEAQRLAAAARVEIERTYQADVAALEKEATRKAAEETDKRIAFQRRLAASVASDLSAALGGFADLAGDTAAQLQQRLEEQGDQLTSAERRQLEEQLAARRKGALAAFRISQGAAIAAASVTAGLAALEAYQSAIATVPYPANLVVAPVSAAAVAVAGAARVAAIAAQPPPTFHTGLAPDEYSARLRVGEGVATSQAVAAVGGPEAMRDLNAGRAPAKERPLEVIFSLDGRPVESALYASRARGGALAQVGTRRAGKSSVYVVGNRG